jgi:hypothetical protein
MGYAMPSVRIAKIKPKINNEVELEFNISSEAGTITVPVTVGEYGSAGANERAALTKLGGLLEGALTAVRTHLASL